MDREGAPHESHSDGLYSAVQRGIIKEMLRLAASDNKKNIVRAIALAEKITPDNHKAEMRFVKEKVMQDHPALKIARHVVHDLSPACRDGFINAFVVNALLRGSQKRQDVLAEAGHAYALHRARQPHDALQPALRRLLRQRVLTPERHVGALFQRIVDEAAEMGVYLITVLGGEPFMRADLLDVDRRQPRDLLPGLHQRHACQPAQVGASPSSATWRSC